MSEQSDDLGFNDFSESARLRKELFESMCTERGATILPGRYGGKYNSNMLALYEKNGASMLILGIVDTNKSGGIQLDTHSLGDHMQLSPKWIDVLIYSLRLSPSSREFSEHLERSRASDSLSTACMYINSDTQEVGMIKINVPE